MFGRLHIQQLAEIHSLETQLENHVWRCPTQTHRSVQHVIMPPYRLVTDSVNSLAFWSP